MTSIKEDFSYNDFVVTAENRWRETISRDHDTEGYFRTLFGGHEWKLEYSNDSPTYMELTCLNLDDGQSVHVELLIYKDFQHKVAKKTRVRFDKKNKKWRTNVKGYEGVQLTVRMLEDRCNFPDFTSSTGVATQMKMDGKLKVGEQIFYINKEVLSCYSSNFEQMFNGNFVEAKKEIVELFHAMDPIIFHDFLLLLTLPGKKDVLPNSGNVAKLLEIAEFFNSNWVQNKCEQQLILADDISVKERIELAKKYGLKKLEKYLPDDSEESDTPDSEEEENMEEEGNSGDEESDD